MHEAVKTGENNGDHQEVIQIGQIEVHEDELEVILCQGTFARYLSKTVKFLYACKHM